MLASRLSLGGGGGEGGREKGWEMETSHLVEVGRRVQYLLKCLMGKVHCCSRWPVVPDPYTEQNICLVCNELAKLCRNVAER